MKKLEKIINADDFGISLGVNQAVINGYQHGILNATSLMINAKYTTQALAALKKMPDLKVGIHLTLTSQKNHKPLLTSKEVPLIVDENGNYKHDFLGLLWLSLTQKKELKKQVRKEFYAQIKKALDYGIKIHHLDSHRHVHMIPSLFTLTRKIKKEFNIPYLRVINENVYLTLKTSRYFGGIFNAGFLKATLLNFFAFINKYKTDTYFYSILYTMGIFGRAVKKIKVPKKYKRIEVNIHPSILKVEQENYSESLKEYLLLHPNRQKEYETMFDVDLKNRISYDG